MPKIKVSLRSIFFKRCKSYFWLSRTSRIYNSICIAFVVVLVLVVVLVFETKLSNFFTSLC